MHDKTLNNFVEELENSASPISRRELSQRGYFSHLGASPPCAKTGSRMHRRRRRVQGLKRFLGGYSSQAGNFASATGDEPRRLYSLPRSSRKRFCQLDRVECQFCASSKLSFRRKNIKCRTQYSSSPHSQAKYTWRRYCNAKPIYCAKADYLIEDYRKCYK